MSGYLGIDPGQTTGWAYFNENGMLQAYGQEKLEGFIDLLTNWPEDRPVQTVIIEDYKLFSWRAKQQSGSRMEASQVIGMVTMWTRNRGASLVKQPASIKPIAERFTQVRPPSDHAQSHFVDAYLHGCYYLVQQGRRPTVLQQQVESEK